MNPIRNILVIVDPTTDEHPSIEKGALLAEKLDARLELYICETKASRKMRLSQHQRTCPDAPFPEDVRPELEELARPLRERGLVVTTDTECADPLDAALADRTKRTSADLVIKDAHHHSIVKRTFLTNTDWYLIRTCPLPLLMTKPRPWSDAPKVVAAVDPGHANDKPAALDHRIVEHASLLSKRLGGELYVLHAYLPAAIARGAGASNPQIGLSISVEDLAFEEQRIRTRIQGLVAEYSVDAGNIYLHCGSPGEVVLQYADALQADIVAMGAIWRGQVERAFIGSTAEAVLEQLPCDELIVKPPDFAAVLPF